MTGPISIQDSERQGIKNSRTLFESLIGSPWNGGDFLGFQNSVTWIFILF